MSRVNNEFGFGRVRCALPESGAHRSHSQSITDRRLIEPRRERDRENNYTLHLYNCVLYEFADCELE